MGTRLSNNLYIDSDISKDEINKNLINDLIKASESAAGFMRGKFVANITTAKSDHSRETKSGRQSRHSTGNAVDIAVINDVSYKTDRDGFTKLGNLLVKELEKLGYVKTTDESGKEKTIIWQSPDHYNHIHISNTQGEASTTTTGDTQTSGSTLDQIIGTSQDVALSSLLKGESITEQIFGNNDQYVKDYTIVPIKHNRELRFAFASGRIESIRDKELVISTKIGRSNYFVKYEGLDDIDGSENGKVYKKDRLGEMSSDVKVTIFDSKGRVINPNELKKLIAEPSDVKKTETEKGRSKKKDKKDDYFKKYKTFGSPTSKKEVEQGWIYKQNWLYNQIKQYFDSKKNKQK